MGSKTTRTLREMTERMRAQGRRIDVLRNSLDTPGTSARTGYSAQIAALQAQHRATSADLVRLTSTPENEEDWARLHERLDRAMAELERGLDGIESQASRRTP